MRQESIVSSVFSGTPNPGYDNKKGEKKNKKKKKKKKRKKNHKIESFMFDHEFFKCEKH